MGYPEISTAEDFCSYVTGIHHRRDLKRPEAFAIGAVRRSENGDVTEAIFPQINRGENFGSAAAFADVAHYRCGNAVYELDFFDFKTLEHLFYPFLEHLDEHPNVAATFKVQRLICAPYNMQPVIVFVGDFNDDTCRGHPVYEAFMKQLVLSAAGMQQ